MHTATTAYALGVGLALVSSAFSLAQDATNAARTQRRPPLRLEIRPAPQYYRQCVDWYVVEHRLTGDTVVPQLRCRWALRR